MIEQCADLIVSVPFTHLLAFLSGIGCYTIFCRLHNRDLEKEDHNGGLG